MAIKKRCSGNCLFHLLKVRVQKVLLARAHLSLQTVETTEPENLTFDRGLILLRGRARGLLFDVLLFFSGLLWCWFHRFATFAFRNN